MVKEIKGENERYKREILREEKGLLAFWEDPEKEEKTREKRNGEEERAIPKPNEYHFLIKEGRSCIPKSSHTQITSEGEVGSLTSVYNK